MNKKKIITILVVVSVFLVGCNKGQVKDDSSNKISTSQEVSNDANVKEETKTNSKEESKDSKSTIKSNSNQKDNQAKEIFFGNWVITKHLASANVQAFSNDDIKNLIGKTLSFSKEKTNSFRDQVSDLNNIVNNPIYKKNIISKDDFESETKYHVTFDKLGIKDENITEISVNDSKSTCCTFYIKDNNTLILSGGGVYLQLDRK